VFVLGGAAVEIVFCEPDQGRGGWGVHCAGGCMREEVRVEVRSAEALAKGSSLCLHVRIVELKGMFHTSAYDKK
jgi:hypothetical protein